MATAPHWQDLAEQRSQRGEVSDARFSNNASANDWQNSEPPEPTRSHRACIAELALRFPCPVSIDGDDYAARIELLTRDTAHLAPGLLRKACDRAAQTARGLPYASEIISAATAVVEDRQRATEPTQGHAKHTMGDKASAYAAGNLAAAQRGMRVMMTAAGEAFKLGDPGERRGIRDDGSVIEPWFHMSAGPGDPIKAGWYVRDEDRGALAACFRDYRSPMFMTGCRIEP